MKIYNKAFINLKKAIRSAFDETLKIQKDNIRLEHLDKLPYALVLRGVVDSFLSDFMNKIRIVTSYSIPMHYFETELFILAHGKQKPKNQLYHLDLLKKNGANTINLFENEKITEKIYIFIQYDTSANLTLHLFDNQNNSKSYPINELGSLASDTLFDDMNKIEDNLDKLFKKKSEKKYG